MVVVNEADILDQKTFTVHCMFFQYIDGDIFISNSLRMTIGIKNLWQYHQLIGQNLQYSRQAMPKRCVDKIKFKVDN